ncbi:hypothetical protein CUMW_164210 [Citrus unshiu]|nr:hypothetical protein CUMW_164210 [Citrus unshiu]
MSGGPTSPAPSTCAHLSRERCSSLHLPYPPRPDPDIPDKNRTQTHPYMPWPPQSAPLAGLGNTRY